MHKIFFYFRLLAKFYRKKKCPFKLFVYISYNIINQNPKPETYKQTLHTHTHTVPPSAGMTQLPLRTVISLIPTPVSLLAR